MEDREVKMKETLRYLQQQEKIKQEQESNDFGAQLMAKTKDMLEAVEKLNAEASAKLLAEQQ